MARILVDFDNVLTDLNTAWVTWINNHYGTNVKPDDITAWEISQFFPSLSRNQVFKAFRDENMWGSVLPIKGAVEYLKKLIDDGNDVYICSTTDYRFIKTKYDLIIKKYFPFLSWNNFIITSNKQIIKADYLIDDAPHNLVGGDYSKILMSAPHNKSYITYGTGIIRVNSWAEIYLIISFNNRLNKVLGGNKDKCDNC